MAHPVETFYMTEYSRSINLLSQQLNSRLGAAVDNGNHMGDKASPVDQVGVAEMTDVVSRFATMPRTDVPTARRWVLPISSDFNQLFDSFDALKVVSDPKSKQVQAAVAAANRRKDRHIIGAFFASALTGVNAGSTESFGTTLTSSDGQNVSCDLGGADSGLSVAKLKEGKRQLMAHDIDLDAEPIYCAINSKQHDNLLGEIQVVSTDFNDRPVLTEGRVVRFLGINFIHTELIQQGSDDTATTSYMNPLWVPNGMHYGNWESTVTNISQRNDLQSVPWQAYVKMTGGATRLELVRVVRIWSR